MKLRNNLLKNNIVAIKTDTIWGLSAIISEANLEKINKVKNSKENKPVTILFASQRQAEKYVDKTQIEFLSKSNKDTTLILKSSKKMMDIIPAYKNVGVRITTNNKHKRILEKTGPIFTTSANITGEEHLNNRKEILSKFKGMVAFAEYKVKADGKPTSILDYTTGKERKVR